jgi:hypothetical protein
MASYNPAITSFAASYSGNGTATMSMPAGTGYGSGSATGSMASSTSADPSTAAGLAATGNGAGKLSRTMSVLSGQKADCQVELDLLSVSLYLLDLLDWFFRCSRMWDWIWKLNVQTRTMIAI